MRAFVVRELAHPSGINLSHDVPEPTAGKDQVLVDVYSAGLNFFDVSNFINRINVLNSAIARLCNLKANTNPSHPYRSYLAPSLQGKLPRTLLSLRDALIDLEIASLVEHKGRLRIE